MENLVCIILDGSGSMAEMGKQFILGNLCRYVIQSKKIDPFRYGEKRFKFFTWSEDIQEIELEDDGGLPLIPKGSARLESLSQLMKTLYSDEECHRFLVCSDGNFSGIKVKEFGSERNALSKVMVRTIAIGGDADHHIMRRLASNKSVFSAEDISVALDSFCFSSDSPPQMPDSIDQIVTGQLVDEEAWDE